MKTMKVICKSISTVLVSLLVFLSSFLVVQAQAQSSPEITVDSEQENAFDYGDNCNWLISQTGTRSCCWCPDPTGAHAWGHVMDLGKIVTDVTIDFEIEPGAGDAGCVTTGYMYYSLDGRRWSLFWSQANLAGWTTYSGTIPVQKRRGFRYVRANTDNCSIDWAQVTVEIPQRCVGAEGPQCGLPVRKSRGGTFRGTVSVGSILHDNCCIFNYPNGFFCGNGGENETVCRDEWDKALRNVGSRRGWVWDSWGPYAVGLGDDIRPVAARRSEPQAQYETITTSELAAPPGTTLDIKDEDFCRSKRFQVTGVDAWWGPYGVCSD